MQYAGALRLMQSPIEQPSAEPIRAPPATEPLNVATSVELIQRDRLWWPAMSWRNGLRSVAHRVRLSLQPRGRVYQASLLRREQTRHPQRTHEYPGSTPQRNLDAPRRSSGSSGQPFLRKTVSYRSKPARHVPGADGRATLAPAGC